MRRVVGDIVALDECCVVGGGEMTCRGSRIESARG
jgi:hypothetical protein